MANTFPHLLLSHATQRPTAPALREKEFGIWQTWTWADVARDVRHLACGLAALGLARGQNLAFVSDNRPNVYMGFAAVQSLGAVPIPLYQDAVAQDGRASPSGMAPSSTLSLTGTRPTRAWSIRS